jgi:hypothetical protein
MPSRTFYTSDEVITPGVRRVDLIYTYVAKDHSSKAHVTWVEPLPASATCLITNPDARVCLCRESPGHAPGLVAAVVTPREGTSRAHEPGKRR